MDATSTLILSVSCGCATSGFSAGSAAAVSLRGTVRGTLSSGSSGTEAEELDPGTGESPPSSSTEAEELETGTGESPPSSGTEAEGREAEELVPETGGSRAAAVSLRGTLSSGCAPITERQSSPAVSSLA